MFTAMTLLADGGGGGGAGQVQEIARTFGVDWQHLGAQIISFCIVCALLHRFAYKPVLTALKQRRERITEALANAERIKAELAETKAQRQELMVQANQQATALIAEAHAAAARVRDQETQRALAAAEQILAQAREAGVRDQERMLLELKHQMGRLVVELSAAVTGKILTADDQRRLAVQAADALNGAAEPPAGRAEEAARQLLAGAGQLGVPVDEGQQSSPTQR
jgi:F-type H+-transporting ATPase subunit b